MKEFLNTLIAWGPLGVFIFAILDGAGVPSPGGLDWLLVLVAINSPERWYWLAGLSVAGSVLGCLILYYVARRAGEAMLAKYRLRPRFQKFERWFQHYGLLTVFIPALVPIPMPLKFFIICTGAFAVPPATFIAVLLAARIPRYLGLAYLGAELGRESFPWLKSHAIGMIAIAAGLFVVLYLLILITDRRRRLTEST
jgi:membrane protein DedA with SNARE-associated domain